MTAPKRQPPVRESEPRAGDFGSLATSKLPTNRNEIKQNRPSGRAGNWRDVTVRQRQNELRKLVGYRQRFGLDIGSPAGWAFVLANLVAAQGSPVTADAVDDAAAVVGLRQRLDQPIAAAAARDTETARRVWHSYALFTPDEVGGLLSVTSVEREEAGLKKIGSVDETAAQRKCRLDTDRAKRRRSEEGGKSRENSDTRLRPWEGLGISDRTYRRRKAAGTLR